MWYYTLLVVQARNDDEDDDETGSQSMDTLASLSLVGVVFVPQSSVF